jgi:hypothetical protein
VLTIAAVRLRQPDRTKVTRPGHCCPDCPLARWSWVDDDDRVRGSDAMRVFGAMDVPPPLYELTTEACSGPTRRCGGGDVACYQQAEKDGYVRVSLYAFCRRDEIHTVPRPLGTALLLGLFAAVGVAVWLRLRGGRSRPT